MKLQEMDCSDRMKVFKKNSSYQAWMREDYPGLSDDELAVLWIDTCIGYAGYDEFDADGIRIK